MTMRKEMQDRKWTWAAIAFQNINAYLIAFMVYQIGCMLVYGIFSIGTVIALAVLAGYIYGIIRKDPYAGTVVNARRSVQV